MSSEDSLEKRINSYVVPYLFDVFDGYSLTGSFVNHRGERPTPYKEFSQCVIDAFSPSFRRDINEWIRGNLDRVYISRNHGDLTLRLQTSHNIFLITFGQSLDDENLRFFKIMKSLL